MHCGHTIEIECWKLLEFDHTRSFLSGGIEEILSIKCMYKVPTDLQCGHSMEVECWKKVKLEKESTDICLSNETGVKGETMVDSQLSFDDKRAKNVYLELVKRVKSLELNREMKCETIVELGLRCGHVFDIECWKKVEYEAGYISGNNIKCRKRISIRRLCGHSLTTECYKKYLNEQTDCDQQITFQYPNCGHQNQIMCCQHPYNQYKAEQLSWFPKTINNEKHKLPPCEYQVYKKLACGHEIFVQCNMSDKAVCSEYCREKLMCGHICTILCKDCKITHKECTLLCEKELFCGHRCESLTCLQCAPCDKQCSVRCEHSVCMRNCRDHCEPCKEPCAWKCPHFKCAKMCFEICDRPRCTHDCKQILQCGHKCSGFCGEPCPIKCILCDVYSFYNCNSGNKDIKTVTLWDCGHSFEYQFLDEYVSTAGNQTLWVKCPSCKSPIYKHSRYDYLIKMKKEVIGQIKEHIIKITKSSSKCTFPVTDSRISHEFKNYLKTIATYLKNTADMKRDKRNQNEIDILTRNVEDLDSRIQQMNATNFQNLLVIQHHMFRLYVFWILHIISRNDMFLETNFQYCPKPLFRNFDLDVQQIPKNDTIFGVDDEHLSSNVSTREHRDNVDKRDRTAKQINRENYSHADSKVLKGSDIVGRIRAQMSGRVNEEIKTLLSLILPHVKDEPYAEEAICYPRLNLAIGLHEEEWTTCEKGHAKSVLLKPCCLTCSTVDLDQFGLIESPKPTEPVNIVNISSRPEPITSISTKSDTAKKLSRPGEANEQVRTRQSEVYSLSDYKQSRESSNLHFVQPKASGHVNKANEINFVQPQTSDHVNLANEINSVQPQASGHVNKANEINFVQPQAPDHVNTANEINSVQPQAPYHVNKANDLNVDPPLDSITTPGLPQHFNFNHYQRSYDEQNILEANFGTPSPIRNADNSPWNHFRGRGQIRGVRYRSGMTSQRPQNGGNFEQDVRTPIDMVNGTYHKQRENSRRRHRGKGHRRGGRKE